MMLLCRVNRCFPWRVRRRAWSSYPLAGCKYGARVHIDHPEYHDEAYWRRETATELSRVILSCTTMAGLRQDVIQTNRASYPLAGRTVAYASHHRVIASKAPSALPKVVGRATRKMPVVSRLSKGVSSQHCRGSREGQPPAPMTSGHHGVLQWATRVRGSHGELGEMTEEEGRGGEASGHSGSVWWVEGKSDEGFPSYIYQSAQVANSPKSTKHSASSIAFWDKLGESRA